MYRSSLVFLLFLIVPAIAVAETAGVESQHAPAHKPENAVGLRVLGGSAFEEGHSAGLFGVGVSAEHAFFHHHLEVEVVGVYVRHGGENGAAGELVLKLPWSLSDAFDLFAGAGGVVFYADEYASGGYLVDVGGRAWWSEHLGAGVELDYVQLLGSRGSKSIEGAVELLYRF